MLKCEVCGKNAAVIYAISQDPSQAKRTLCLTCALKQKEQGMQGIEQLLAAQGVTPENAASIQANINDAMEAFEGQGHPQDLLEQMMQMGLNPEQEAYTLADFARQPSQGSKEDEASMRDQALDREIDARLAQLRLERQRRMEEEALQHSAPFLDDVLLPLPEEGTTDQGAAKVQKSGVEMASSGASAQASAESSLDKAAADKAVADKEADKAADKAAADKAAAGGARSEDAALQGSVEQNEVRPEAKTADAPQAEAKGEADQVVHQADEGSVPEQKYAKEDEKDRAQEDFGYGDQGLYLVGAARGGKDGDDAPNDWSRESGQELMHTQAKDNGQSDSSDEQPSKKRYKFLDQFGQNLNDRAKVGALDPLVGREEELSRVIQILNRRNKNNPVLLGEPGVGKTAIAEGLAARIVAGDVPDKLLDLEVYLLDMTAMVAGTQFRGQFESRMKGLVEEAKQAGHIVLVIDELHNIMGAGDAEGAMNAANILKPALARGEIRVLGSTTLDEYRRFIEKDSALERRFQQVIVEEPSTEEAIAMLEGTRAYYERHHHVHFQPGVIAEAVRLSQRYITHRFLPDKAIDLLDEAGSKANLDNKILVELHHLHKELDEALELERRLLERGADATQDIESFYELQAENKSKIARLESRLKELEAQNPPKEITVEDLAEVVSHWTGIPLERLTETQVDRLMNLESRIHERLIGQDEAVKALARAIRRNRAGLGAKRKPASFIFVGPTGVGKTELVKALALVMFDQEDAFIRLDMSEFMEPYSASKLIGAPPGYVGYDDGNQFTERVRRKPYSVILLDEIEKAHADIMNLLLQVLDEGRLTDNQGRTVNFENTIIIMTSNAGMSRRGGAMGFAGSDYQDLERKAEESLRQLFRPEFLNRVDDICVFQKLSEKELRQIVDLMLGDLKARFKERGMDLCVSDEAKDALAKEGYDPEYGARPLRKVIMRRIEDPLADKVISGALEGCQLIRVAYDANEKDPYQISCQ